MSPANRSHSASGKKVRRHTANPPTGKVGFLAATQVYSGGGAYWPAVSGDFNGDKVPDIAAEVEYYDTGSSSYLDGISVVLSNGDGTFKSPVITTSTDTCPALIAADVNGDGKTDLIVGHAPNTCGNTNTTPTFDVWLSNGDGTFALSTNVNNTIPATGVGGGTLADVNGDAKLDIVLVDDGNPANVWTFIGNGDGTFQSPTSVVLSGQVGNDTIITDLNGDGFLDIVANDYSTNEIVVYLATSATTYAAAAPYDTVDHVWGACGSNSNFPLAVGDLNGDGKPEIVNANCNDSGDDVTVYVNNGDGTFQAGVYYDGAESGGTNSGPAVLYTESVVIADVNGDGYGDILCSNDDSSDITVLLGKADGTVTVPTVGYAAGGWIYMPLVVADFNNDGFLDIVVPDDEFSFVYLRGYGDGSFRAALDYYAPSNAYSWTYGIATGDFNGDKHPDFVIGNICNSCTTPMGITVYLSNADGTLQPGVNYGTTSDFGYVAVADFNGDGHLDIAATDQSTGVVQIFNGDGTGAFTAGSTFATDLALNYPRGISVGDFNKDGHPDLAIVNPGGGDVAILLNDGSGNFPTPNPITLNAYARQGVAVVDLNGDGNLDLVLPLRGGDWVAVLLGNGDGTFQTEQDFSIGGTNPDALTLADFDGDGKLDVAVVVDGGGGQDIGIAKGNGDGTFGTFTLVPSSLQDYNLDLPYPEDIKAADIDGDGKVDLVYTNEEYGTIGVLFGKGDGTFFDPVEFPSGQTNWGMTVADVNGDNAPDVVTASYDFAGVTVLFNANGTGAMGDYDVSPDVTTATVTAGSTATFHLTITPTKHYNGTITFACPAGLDSTMTCTFNPSSVTLDGLTAVPVVLTITTKAPSTPAMRVGAAINLPRNSRPGSSSMLLASLTGMGVFAMFLAGSLGKKRDRWSALIGLALAMSLFFAGCGGSSNHPIVKGNTTSTVTSSNAKVVAGTQITFTGAVTGSGGTPTGTVTFLDGTTTLGTGTLASGAATYQTSTLTAGVHSITISYGGDSNFNTSTSAALSQEVQTPGTPVGPYTITVKGTGTAGTNGVGTAVQSVPLTVTVQ